MSQKCRRNAAENGSAACAGRVEKALDGGIGERGGWGLKYKDRPNAPKSATKLTKTVGGTSWWAQKLVDTKPMTIEQLTREYGEALTKHWLNTGLLVQAADPVTGVKENIPEQNGRAQL